MSGTGGGGNWRPPPDQEIRPVDPNEDTPPDACDITEITTLSSPNPAVSSTLQAGDVLNIVLKEGPPRQLLAMRSSDVAGAITSPMSPQIMQCISHNGLSYVAVVQTVRGGSCGVEVRLE